MPAFRAMKNIMNKGQLANIPVINVAYGSATQEWAKKYGVAERLVFDPAGKLIVRPLGISTFTTFVLDKDGTILLRDRPDRSGFVDRIKKEMGVSQ